MTMLPFTGFEHRKSRISGSPGPFVQPGCTMLLAGAAWYPDARGGCEDRYALIVNAPQGTVAVTAGNSAGGVTTEQRPHLVSFGPAGVDTGRSSAGCRSLHRQAAGNSAAVSAATYFSPALQHLSARLPQCGNGTIPAAVRDALWTLRRSGSLPWWRIFFQQVTDFPPLPSWAGACFKLPFIIHTSLGPRNRPLLVGQRRPGGCRTGELE